MTERLRAAVVLGSGGARGYAHIGGLQVLDERGFDVVAVSGTSMGAIVGGVAAAGKLEEYTDWSLGLTQREVFRLLDLTAAPGGAIRAERIIAKVGDILGGVTIEALPIPYTAVATDLLARREVWFQRGPAIQAIRASIAIPGVITPVVINGRTLVDGGLMNPVPIEPTVAVSADVTVAINLSGHRTTHASEGTPIKETSEERPFEEWASRLRRGTTEVLESERLRAIASRFGVGHRRSDAESAALVTGPSVPSAASTLPEAWVIGRSDIRTIDLLAMSFETMSALITRYRMAGSPPDVLVNVPSNAVGTLDFHRAAEMIELGRQLTTEALDRAGY